MAKLDFVLIWPVWELIEKKEVWPVLMFPYSRWSGAHGQIQEFRLGKLNLIEKFYRQILKVMKSSLFYFYLSVIE